MNRGGNSFLPYFLLYSRVIKVYFWVGIGRTDKLRALYVNAKSELSIIDYHRLEKILSTKRKNFVTIVIIFFQTHDKL